MSKRGNEQHRVYMMSRWRHGPSVVSRLQRQKNIWLTRSVTLGYVVAQFASLFVLMTSGGQVLAATAPTVADYQESNWSDGATSSETTGTLTWSAGNFIVVVGSSEAGTYTLATPTATGLTFSLVSYFGQGVGNVAPVYLWTATATSGGSSTITSAGAGTNPSGSHGISAYAYSGSDGLGAVAVSSSADANLTASLSRTYSNSAVVNVMADFAAVGDTTITLSPSSGGTSRVSDNVSGTITSFVNDWTDQGASGSTSYGIANYTGGTPQFTRIIAEIRGNASDLEQEGYRWRDDDNSETSATWLASQDTNITRAADTNTRLRTLINATSGDPDSNQYQLEFKKSSDSLYKRVPTAIPAAGAVTFGEDASYDNGTGTGSNPTVPGTLTPSSELWAAVGSKNNATHSSASPNWTKVLQQNSGASWTVSIWRYTGADATAAIRPDVSWTGSVAYFGYCWRMEGRTGTSPIGTPSTNTGTGTTHSSTGVTTTYPGSRVMYIDATAVSTVLAQPSGWSENFDVGATGTRLVMGGKDISNSGTGSGNISVTGGNAAWVQTQIELPANQSAIVLAASSNIVASGASTTAQLTAPSGKTTSDFVTGRIQDDMNPASAINITSVDYTELEWSLKAVGTLVSNGDVYQFRVTYSGQPVETYTVTPQMTIGTNTAPSSPSSLAQKKTDDTVVSTGGWTSETSIKLTATVTDSDGGDTVKICAEVKAIGTALTSPAGDGDGCSSSGVSSGGTATVTIGSLSNGTEYHWQIKAKDAAGSYSSWVGYGSNTENPPTNPADRDFGVDTSAPSGGTVYDGTAGGTDSGYNDGSLSSLSANWSGFSFTVSGLQKYEYAIGTSAGGTQVKNWTDNSTNTSVTATSLTLQTSQLYYFSVKGYDNAGNTVTVNSNGQLVAPSLSFSISPTSLTFDNLNAANSYTNTKTTTLTTSTNAYGGYVVRLAALDYLRSPSNITIPDFNGGSYASPDSWQSGDTGFGYTSSDTSVQGVNKFQASTCPGGSALISPGCYVPYSQSKPGDIIADHTANVTGSSISNEQFTITHRLTISNTQSAANYTASLLYAITALY